MHGLSPKPMAASCRGSEAVVHPTPLKTGMPAQREVWPGVSVLSPVRCSSHGITSEPLFPSASVVSAQNALRLIVSPQTEHHCPASASF